MDTHGERARGRFPPAGGNVRAADRRGRRLGIPSRLISSKRRTFSEVLLFCTKKGGSRSSAFFTRIVSPFVFLPYNTSRSRAGRPPAQGIKIPADPLARIPAGSCLQPVRPQPLRGSSYSHGGAFRAAEVHGRKACVSSHHAEGQRPTVCHKILICEQIGKLRTFELENRGDLMIITHWFPPPFSQVRGGL